jgi:hypothetical protein
MSSTTRRWLARGVLVGAAAVGLLALVSMGGLPIAVGAGLLFSVVMLAVVIAWAADNA